MSRVPPPDPCRSLENKLTTVSTQLEDIQEKMYDFEQNKEK